MYFPYMRAKRNELLALRELVEQLKKAKFIKPIIEPVNENPNDIVNAALVFENHDLGFIYVVNPVVGDLVNKGKTRDEILEAVKKCSTSMEYGVIVDHETTNSVLDLLLKTNTDRKTHLIHSSRIPGDLDIEGLCKKYNIADHYLLEENLGKKYIERIHAIGATYVIDDPFKKMPRNEDYCPEEFFSDRYATYPDDNHSGYGDFLTVGKPFDKSGFRPKTVAIHLTYLRDEEIWIKHFKSYTRDEPGGEEELFIDALGKLVNYLENNEDILQYSSSAKEFIRLYEESHYPGLGYVKKLSMKHHVELMLHLLS